MTDDQKGMQDRDRGWERLKVIATIIDAISRAAEIFLRR